MSGAESLVEVKGPEQFDTVVIEGSAQQVVVVDFWAPWCGPCRVLGPVLERVVAALAGKVRLAKVNVDEPENQPLAVQYRIRGIPTVKIFRDGKMVSDFVGALPPAEVQRQIESALGGAGGPGR